METATLVLEAATVDLTRGRVARADGGEPALTDTERRLLAYLAGRPRQDVPRDELLREVWGYAGAAVTRAVDDAMKRLRAKVEARPGAPFHLLTAHGVGYRFEPSPDAAAAAAPGPSTPAGRPAIALGDRLVDLDRRTLTGPEGAEPLSALEAGVLACLVEARGRPVSTQDLLRKVWGHVRTEQRGAVEKLVSRLRARLGEDGDAPKLLHTVRGGGYRLEVPVSRAPLPAVAPGLFGREGDLARVTAAIADGARLVTLTGAAGIGKTRLAREVVAAQGGLFCPLATARSESDVRDAVAAGLGLSPGASDAQIAEAVRRGGGALVLDDCERSLGPIAAIVGRWLAATPMVLIATSREPLGLPAERLVELSPLDAAASTALFLARAAALDASGSFAASPHLPAIVAALDGLPLAIELAAGRARVLDPASLRDRLADRFSVLRGPEDAGRGALWAAIARSWEACTAAERMVLAQATVFPASFTLAAAEAVLEAGGAPVIDVVESLRRRSLLQVERFEGGLSVVRFALLQAIRDFATPASPDPRLARRFTASSADRAEALASRWFGPETAAVRVELDRELPTFVAAASLSLAHDPDHGVRIANALTDPYRSAVFLGDLLAAALPHAHGEARAHITAHLVDAHVEAGDEAAAQRLLDAMPEPTTPVQRVWQAMARATVDLAVNRRLPETEAMLLDVLPALGSVEPYAGAVLYSFLARCASDLFAGERYLRGSLAIARRVGDRAQEGQIRMDLARFCLQRGALAEAAALYRSGLALWPEAREQRAEIAAAIAMEQGRYAEAIAAYERAIVWHQQSTERAYTGYIYGELGLAHHVAGAPDAAEDAYQEAIERLPPTQGHTVWAQGHLALLTAQRGGHDGWNDLTEAQRGRTYGRITQLAIGYLATGDGAAELLEALAATRVPVAGGLAPIATSVHIRHQVDLIERELTRRGVHRLARRASSRAGP